MSRARGFGSLVWRGGCGVFRPASRSRDNLVTGLGLLAGALLLAVSGVSARGDEIMVFAAASLSDALREIGGGYESASGDRVRFNFEASGTLARQIEAGAPADVFFPADEGRMDQLQSRGLILESSRRSILSNGLVVVVAAGSDLSIRSAADLVRPDLARLALADPEIAPAGVYAKKYLEAQRLWDAVASRVIPVSSVRAVLAAVETGNADAGFVYRTDAARASRARVAFEVPA